MIKKIMAVALLSAGMSYAVLVDWQCAGDRPTNEGWTQVRGPGWGEYQNANHGAWLGTDTLNNNVWGMTSNRSGTPPVTELKRDFGVELPSDAMFEVRYKLNHVHDGNLNDAGFQVLLYDSEGANVVNMYLISTATRLRVWNTGAGEAITHNQDVIIGQEYLYRTSGIDQNTIRIQLFTHDGDNVLSEIWDTEITGVSMENVAGVLMGVSNADGSSDSNNALRFNKIQVIPEPMTASALMLGSFLLLAVRRFILKR